MQPNPLIVASANRQFVRERVVAVLNEFHFPVIRESRLDGQIETGYRTGSGVLEPWHGDAVGLENRLEGSLQSIRRKLVVTVRPARSGGFAVGVQAFQEIEDLDGLAANSPGAATFQESKPLDRDLDLVIGQSAPSGWIAQGRDFALEQRLLQRIQAAFRAP